MLVDAESCVMLPTAIKQHLAVLSVLTLLDPLVGVWEVQGPPDRRTAGMGRHQWKAGAGQCWTLRVQCSVQRWGIAVYCVRPAVP